MRVIVCFLKGKIKIEGQDNTEFAVLGTGDFFGETALISEDKRRFDKLRENNENTNLYIHFFNASYKCTGFRRFIFWYGFNI